MTVAATHSVAFYSTDMTTSLDIEHVLMTILRESAAMHGPQAKHNGLRSVKRGSDFH